MSKQQAENRGCLGLLFAWFGRPAGARDNGSVRAADEEALWPYRRKDFLFSRAEFSFFRVLEQAVGPQRVVCPKIGLGDLLYLPKGIGKDYARWRNRIDRKHADFVVCDAETMRPLLVVELDDTSHETQRAAERDAVKDKALAAAGLPMLRVKARRTYDVEAVASAVRRVVGETS